jgi:hypothetical protein
MTREYLASLDDDGEDFAVKGTFTVEIVDARATETKAGEWKNLWLDLKLLDGGPDAGKVVYDVLLWVPTEDDDPKSIRAFRSKARGLLKVIAKTGASTLPDNEALEAIASVLIGHVFVADLYVDDYGQKIKSSRSSGKDPKTVVEEAEAVLTRAQSEEKATFGDDGEAPF